MFSFSGWGRQKAKALPPVCNKWSEILTLLKVVKINANSSAESVPSGIFQAFKSLPRRSCFGRGSADPLTGQYPIRYI